MLPTILFSTKRSGMMLSVQWFFSGMLSTIQDAVYCAGMLGCQDPPGPKGITRGIPQETPQEIPQEIAQEIPQETPQYTRQETPG